SFGQVAARVWSRLVGLERCLVPIQLIEDPLQRLALYQVGGVHERSGLTCLDGLDGLGDHPLVSLGAGLLFAREAHAQTQHQFPPGRVTPCSHSLCCASTRNLAYLLYGS